MSKPLRWVLLALCSSCALAPAGACGADDDDAGGAAGTTPGGSSGGAAGSSGAAGGTMTAGASGSTPMTMTPMGGCGTESFAKIYQDIFANETYMCSSPVCHGKPSNGSATVGNLELMSKDIAYMDLVGVKSDGVLCGDADRPRVVKGNAAGSLLVQKLRSETVMCGSIMPVTGNTITDAELARITSWINAGACNN